MKLHFTLILLCSAALGAVGVAAFISSHRPTDSTQTSTQQLYQVKGSVRSLESDGVTVHIAHEEIPGFMPAMEMPFTVKNPALLDGLKPGDSVFFQLLVTKEDSWITHIEKSSAAPSLPVEEDAPGSPRSQRLEVGDLVPDCTLVDQNGNSFRLADFRGKAVLLTFIYTRCPLPNFCPLMSRNFASLQERFAKQHLGDKVQLVSLSFDPEFDTPSVLKRYSGLYPHEGTNWTFATATSAEVNRMAESFGLLRESANGLINHDLRTALIGPNGRLVHVWRSNVWVPLEVERRVQETLQSALAKR